jgi:hypothetical protein
MRLLTRGVIATALTVITSTQVQAGLVPPSGGILDPLQPKQNVVRVFNATVIVDGVETVRDVKVSIGTNLLYTLSSGHKVSAIVMATATKATVSPGEKALPVPVKKPTGFAVRLTDRDGKAVPISVTRPRPGVFPLRDQVAFKFQNHEIVVRIPGLIAEPGAQPSPSLKQP